MSVRGLVTSWTLMTMSALFPEFFILLFFIFSFVFHTSHLLFHALKNSVKVTVSRINMLKIERLFDVFYIFKNK